MNAIIDDKILQVNNRCSEQAQNKQWMKEAMTSRQYILQLEEEVKALKITCEKQRNHSELIKDLCIDLGVQHKIDALLEERIRQKVLEVQTISPGKKLQQLNRHDHRIHGGHTDENRFVFGSPSLHQQLVDSKNKLPQVSNAELNSTKLAGFAYGSKNLDEISYNCSYEGQIAKTNFNRCGGTNLSSVKESQSYDIFGNKKIHYPAK